MVAIPEVVEMATSLETHTCGSHTGGSGDGYLTRDSHVW